MNGPLPAGSRIDSLRIDRVLGQGAFGITYLVTDTVLDTPFALKEYFPPQLARRAGDGRVEIPQADDRAAAFRDGLRHFLNEGRTAARLDHPHLVKVFRCFEANGTAYLLMPWYRGETLPELLQRGGTLSEAEALALARPVLDALEYLHRAGVVHRDVKPANLYITEGGQPILLDFGAAAQPRLGSEGYAAPEQSGAAGAVGPWTDIYGLAATLYRCVSGRVPVAAGRRQAAADERAPDPLEPLDRLLPGGAYPIVGPAIRQGLMLEPARRPQSVAQWRTAFAGSGSVPPQEGREWLSMVLLGVFGLLLAAAVGWLLLDHDGEPAAEPVAEQAGPGSPPASNGLAEAARWQATLDADSAYGYRLFMSDFPESVHNDQARLHLERLDHQAWAEAREGINAGRTRAAIEAYRSHFPNGLHESDALIALEELRLAEEAEARDRSDRERRDDEAWAAAAAQRSLEAVNGYLSAWSDGRHVAEAHDLRQALQSAQNDHRAFTAAGQLATIDAYQSYLEAFPHGAHVAAALEAIDALTLRPGKTFRDCEGCPEMVVVPAGSFWQGSAEGAPGALQNEMPRRTVTFAEPFAVGVHEVTFDEWALCVAEGGCAHRPPDNGWGRGRRPVIMVSWNDAAAYADWLGKKTDQAYRLPSESQWEYVARAGEDSDWPGGDAAAICAFANVAGRESGLRWQHDACADPAALETLPVGTLQPNAFGVYDSIGNVAEWTLDCMNLSYLDGPVDGSAWGRGICSSRMTRGGSWFTGTRDIRLPARFNLKNGDRNDFTGFRVVRKVDM